MDYIFDNTYVLNSDICREVGELFAIYDEHTREFIGYKAVAKKFVNHREVCSVTYPRIPEDLSPDDLAHAKQISV